MKEALSDYLNGLENAKKSVQYSAKPKKQAIIKRVLPKTPDPIMEYFKNKNFVNPRLMAGGMERVLVKSDYIIR